MYTAIAWAAAGIAFSVALHIQHMMHVTERTRILCDHIAKRGDLECAHIRAMGDLECAHAQTMSDLQCAHIRERSQDHISHHKELMEECRSHINDIEELRSVRMQLLDLRSAHRRAGELVDILLSEN